MKKAGLASLTPRRYIDVTKGKKGFSLNIWQTIKKGDGRMPNVV